MQALDELLDPSLGVACTYGKADIAGAVKLAEEVTAFTPDVEVILFTDMEYVDAGKVKIHSMRDISDWNAAILDVRAILEENKYTILERSRDYNERERAVLAQYGRKED